MAPAPAAAADGDVGIIAPPPGVLTNDLGMVFKLISPGRFQMGAQAGLPDEQPVCTRCEFDKRFISGYTR